MKGRCCRRGGGSSKTGEHLVFDCASRKGLGGKCASGARVADRHGQPRPRSLFSSLTMSLIESFLEIIATRSANAGLYLSSSLSVILCQIGRITFRPPLSLANRPFSSCSVQCFFLKNAFEKTTIPNREFARPRPIEARRPSPQTMRSLSYQTRIPARLAALTSGSTNPYLQTRDRQTRRIWLSSSLSPDCSSMCFAA